MLDKEIIVSGLRVHYFQSDKLSPEAVCVFLHGWKSEASHLTSIFSDQPNYIALDLPGFGRTDLPTGTWGVTDYARFLQDFVNKLEVKNPILIGHSFGGAVILNYCALGGEAAKAILIASSGVRIKSWRKKLYKLLAKSGKIIFSLPGLSLIADWVRKKFYKAIDSEDYIEAGRLTENYKKIIGQDLREDAAKIKVPVAMIWGDKDTAAPLEYGKMLHDLIPNSTLHVIPDTGHFCFLDKPAEFKSILEKEINV